MKTDTPEQRLKIYEMMLSYMDKIRINESARYYCFCLHLSWYIRTIPNTMLMDSLPELKVQEPKNKYREMESYWWNPWSTYGFNKIKQALKKAIKLTKQKIKVV